MFTNAWPKYLPVLRIVLKKSLREEQKLVLNIPDFERAGYHRKTGYKFHLNLKYGKVNNVIIDAPLASSLVSTLLEDKILKDLLMENEFDISLSSKYELTIKHISKEGVTAEAGAEEANI